MFFVPSTFFAQPRPRIPLLPHSLSLPTQFLEDTDRLIGAVSQAYGSGQLDAAAALQARLHENLTYLAAVADASTPSTAEASGGAEIGNPPPQEAPPQQQFHAPVPQIQQQQVHGQFYQQQQGGGAPPRQ